jgi:hypothetical protein
MFCRDSNTASRNKLLRFNAHKHSATAAIFSISKKYALCSDHDIPLVVKRLYNGMRLPDHKSLNQWVPIIIVLVRQKTKQNNLKIMIELYFVALYTRDYRLKEIHKKIF